MPLSPVTPVYKDLPARFVQDAKGSVLFIGASYYNNWYLSRELRSLGWIAETFAFGAEGADSFLHGTDYYLRDIDAFPLPDNSDPRFVELHFQVQIITKSYMKWVRSGMQSDSPWGWRSPRQPVWKEFLRSWRYSLPRATPKFTGVLDLLVALQHERNPTELRHLLNAFLPLIHTTPVAAVEPLLRLHERYDVVHFTAINNLRWFYYLNPYLFGSMPIGWDIDILKRLGIKICYSNTGCMDGVSQTSFRTWDKDPICNICRFRNEPSVCSDEKNLTWGALRNHLVDYQILLGGNRIDFNDDPSVHEVPEFYCLDPDFWRPDLPVPAAYQLNSPRETVKIYHAVGNYSSRTKDEVNIKTTHVIVPAVERLKAEGYPVELVFCTNVPNRDVRFYQVQSDIIVDMLTYGFFGANLREAMMLGKPTVCFLRPEWLQSMRAEIPGYVNELPVVSATPETIHDVLVDLIQHPEKRQALGARGRAFALKWHSRQAGAKRFDRIYSQLVSATSWLFPPRRSA